MSETPQLFCGIDWASDHHDIALIDATGKPVVKARLGHTAEGWTKFLEILAEAGDTPEHPIPVAIETDKGLWVAALKATGRTVYAVNPLAASRYRTRRSVAGAKSDAADAVMLAEILRTDQASHRPIPTDSPLAEAVKVLARAQQDAVWARVRLGQQITALLGDFYPAALDAIAALPTGGLARADARLLLAAAPTPAAAQQLSKAKLRGLLKRSGRVRYLERDVEALHAIFRAERLHQAELVEHAMGLQLSALLGMFEAACAAEQALASEVTAHFEQHPDAQIITSFPGLGTLTGARVLAEIGDDRARFADARALKAYAGSAPITRASGKKTLVAHRQVKNRRLNAVGPIWTLTILKASPGAREHYQRRRDRGDWHRQAQRHLFNRLLGCLWHCLQTGTVYQETQAFSPPLSLAA
jgi:transposase